MNDRAAPPLRERWNQFVIFANLPPGRQLTTTDVHQYVHGFHLNDGAKPWPHYRDAQTKVWWRTVVASDTMIDGLVWMIPLEQLARKPRHTAELFLELVLPELSAAAARFGASAEPESSIPAALEKMDQVVRDFAILNYRMQIIVAAPDGGSYGVAQWLRALKGAGLQWGDGDLFWLYDNFRELFCAEPHSKPGYFHPDDLESEVAFPDIALHFRVRDSRRPAVVLQRMSDVGQQVASDLGAVLLAVDGSPFNLEAAENELNEALEKLQSVRRTERA